MTDHDPITDVAPIAPSYSATFVWSSMLDDDDGTPARDALPIVAVVRTHDRPAWRAAILDTDGHLIAASDLEDFVQVLPTDEATAWRRDQ